MVYRDKNQPFQRKAHRFRREIGYNNVTRKGDPRRPARAEHIKQTLSATANNELCKVSMSHNREGEMELYLETVRPTKEVVLQPQTSEAISRAMRGRKHECILSTG